MKKQNLCEILKRYNVSICYVFGSQKEKALQVIEGFDVSIDDPESDIDIAVVFKDISEDNLSIYARLSVDLEEIFSPFKVDLVFMHEVDHLFQLEVINGYCVYYDDEKLKEEFEEKIMMFASDQLEIFKLNERDFLEAIENGYFKFEYKAD